MSAKRAALITMTVLIAMIGVATGIGAHSVAQTAVAVDGYGISAHYGHGLEENLLSK